MSKRKKNNHLRRAPKTKVVASPDLSKVGVIAEGKLGFDPIDMEGWFLRTEEGELVNLHQMFERFRGRGVRITVADMEELDRATRQFEADAHRQLADVAPKADLKAVAERLKTPELLPDEG